MEVEVDHRALAREVEAGATARCRPWRFTSARYSRISRSRCSRSSSANSRKICLPSDSSNCSPYFLKKRCEPRSHLMPMSSACWSLPCDQPLGALGEDAVGRALEEQERGPRLELRIALQQLGVARLQLAEVLLLFRRQVLEHLAGARVARHLGGAGVELEAAALGGDGDAQRVAREHQVAVAVVGGGGAPCPGSPRRCRRSAPRSCPPANAARRRHLLDQHLDVRAQELEGAMAGLADQMEVARLPVGVLEPRAPLTEVDLAGDARVHHPLQRAVDGGAADATVVLADDVHQIVGAQVTFLAQEHVDDLLALARALAALRR